MPPRTLVSASPTSYVTTSQDHASMLAFSSLGSQTYPQWPVSTAYDPTLPTTSDFMPSYAAPTANDTRTYIPQDYAQSNTYPSYQSTHHFGGYPDPSDFSNLDPRFWPPSTQPGA